MVMYIITSKLNSTFTNRADKLKRTAKVVRKNSNFRFWAKNNACMQQAAKHLWKILNSFLLLDSFFCLIANEKVLLLSIISNTRGSVSSGYPNTERAENTTRSEIRGVWIGDENTVSIATKTNE